MMTTIHYDEWNKQMDEWAKKWRDQRPAPKEVLMHNHALREGCTKRQWKSMAFYHLYNDEKTSLYFCLSGKNKPYQGG